MQTKNDAMRELWRVLSGTQTAYETALKDLDDNAGMDLVTEITSMRKANIEQVEKYLSDAATDVSELEAPERVYSALDWASAVIDGPEGVEAQVRKYESNVLGAYDRAIEPYSVGDAELQFLTEQYQHLSQKLGGLTPDRAAA